MSSDPLEKYREHSVAFRARKPCPVARVLQELPSDEVKLLNAAMEEDQELAIKENRHPITPKGIANTLAEIAPGAWTGNWQNVLRHRNRECSCYGGGRM